MSSLIEIIPTEKKEYVKISVNPSKYGKIHLIVFLNMNYHNICYQSVSNILIFQEYLTEQQRCFTQNKSDLLAQKNSIIVWQYLIQKYNNFYLTNYHFQFPHKQQKRKSSQQLYYLLARKYHKSEGEESQQQYNPMVQCHCMNEAFGHFFDENCAKTMEAWRKYQIRTACFMYFRK